MQFCGTCLSRILLGGLLFALLSGCDETPPALPPTPNPVESNPAANESTALEKAKGASFVEWQREQAKRSPEPMPPNGRQDRLDLDHDMPAWQREIENRLQKPVEFNFAGESLPEVLDYLGKIAGVPMHYDAKAMALKPRGIGRVRDDCPASTQTGAAGYRR